MILLVLAAAALALTGISALRGDIFSPQAQWAAEEPMQPPVVYPAQLRRAGQLRYHYGNLNPEEQAACDDIYARALCFPESIRLDLELESLNRVFHALTMDQPLLFHISSAYFNYTTDPRTGRVTAFLPDYLLAREEYEARCQALARAVETFTVPAGGEQFGCELALHDQLIRRCAYAEDITPPEKSTAYGALVEGSASCEGYARAMQLLLDLQGIDCYIVTGEATNSEGKTERHAWNKVRIDGAWYQLDPTWNDPVNQDGGHVTSHAYFNLSDGEIGQTHELTDLNNPCASTAANYFVRKGLLFGSLDRAAEELLTTALRDAFAAGDNAVELRFTDEAAMKAGQRYLFEKQNIYRVLNNAALGGAPIKTEQVEYMPLAALRIIKILPLKK